MSGILRWLLRCQRRECGRPIRLTRSLPLHAGKASTRSSDSGRQLLWRQVVGLVAYDGAVGPLGERFLPGCVKQRAVHDRRLLARQDLILIFDLADIEVVSQQIVQRATAERDATARRARREPFCPGPNVAFFEIPERAYRRKINRTSSASSSTTAILPSFIS